MTTGRINQVARKVLGTERGAEWARRRKRELRPHTPHPRYPRRSPASGHAHRARAVRCTEGQGRRTTKPLLTETTQERLPTIALHKSHHTRSGGLADWCFFPRLPLPDDRRTESTSVWVLRGTRQSGGDARRAIGAVPRRAEAPPPRSGCGPMRAIKSPLTYRVTPMLNSPPHVHTLTDR